MLGWVLLSESDTQARFVAVRMPLAATTLLMNATVLLEQLLLAAGRAKSVFLAGVVASWAVQLPAVAALVAWWRTDLIAVYSGVGLGYAAAAALLAWRLLRLDWSALGDEAYARSSGGDDDSSSAGDADEDHPKAGTYKPPSVVPAMERIEAYPVGLDVPPEVVEIHG